MYGQWRRMYAVATNVRKVATNVRGGDECTRRRMYGVATNVRVHSSPLPVMKPDILQLPISPKDQKIAMENEQETSGKRSKSLLYERPVNLRRNFKAIGKKTLYGTDLHKIESERDYKVSLFCYNIPASWIIWTVAIVSTVCYLKMAWMYAFKHVVFYKVSNYQVVPWILAFFLDASVLVAMWMKSAKLLIPLRIMCAIYRCLTLALLTIGLIFTIVGVFEQATNIYFNSKDLIQYAATLTVVSGISYLFSGILANAATRCYYFFKSQESS